MKDVNIALAVAGLLVLVAGAFTQMLRRIWFTGPMVAVLVGIGVGPRGLDWLKPHEWGHQYMIFEQAVRLTLAVSLMAVALRIPRGYMLQRWKPLLLLLGPIMVCMWLTSSLLVGWLLSIPLWPALLCGAIITPTDPVLSSSIVSGKFARRHLPDNLRYLLSSESGANDGLTYLFALLPILMMEHSSGTAWYEWLTRVLFWEVAAAVLVGLALGYLAGKSLVFARKNEMTREGYNLVYVTALAIMILGLTRLMGTDGILAVFAAGRGYVWAVNPKERISEQNAEESLNIIILLPVFMLFGAMIPWEAWQRWGTTGIILAIAIMLLRRLPWLLLGKKGLQSLARWPDALFLGWFGPIGVAALFYAMLAIHKVHFHTGWHVAALVIFVSVFVHGLTAAPLSLLYDRYKRRQD